MEYRDFLNSKYAKHLQRTYKAICCTRSGSHRRPVKTCRWAGSSLRASLPTPAIHGQLFISLKFIRKYASLTADDVTFTTAIITYKP